MKKFTSIVCSICLLLFLLDGGLSLLDDSLGLIHVHVLGGLRALVFLFFIPVALLTYGLIGVTPMVPKRWFLPILLYAPAALLGMILFAIYHSNLLPAATWCISLVEASLGLWVLWRAQGKIAFHWPLVPEAHMGDKAFRWSNLLGFLAGNFFVLLPGMLAGLLVCASLALDHFTAGYLKLQSDGLVARAKTYVRADGKTILLMPMMHMGEADFYSQVARSFPRGAVILQEGVTDRKNLQNPKLDYSHLAMSLGLCSQKQEFSPSADGNPGDGPVWRRADVDVADFSPPTINFLNLIARFYANGPDSSLLQELLGKSPDATLQEQLVTDLLVKRNEHLLGEIRTQLQSSNLIVVPWGAAHMPGISSELEHAGFHVSETQEFKIFNFRTVADALSAKSE